MQIKILISLSFVILISHTLSENISLSSKILTAEESFKIFIKEDKNNLIISMKINERSYITQIIYLLKIVTSMYFMTL